MRARLSLLVVSLVAASSFGVAHADGPIALCNVPIQMSDGVVLRATITRPDSGVHPTILSVTGYSKGASQNCAPSTSDIVKAGYNEMTLDDRGTGSSGGRWDIWSERTQKDYPEVLHWLESQPWQDGRIGTAGTSYLAITSLLVAETGDPHIKAVWADYPMADAYRDVTFFGGNLDTTFMPTWFGFTQGTTSQGDADLLTQDTPGSSTWIQNLYDHITAAPVVFGKDLITASLLGDKSSPEAPYDSEASRVRSPITRIDRIHAAVWMNGGWFDIFQRGEPILFNALMRNENIPDGGVKWIQGPDYHAASDANWNQLGVGTESQTEVSWFDHWIKGTPNGIDSFAPAHLWDVNTNKWETANDWPIPGTDWQSLYFNPTTSGSAHSLNDGSLTADPPSTPARELLPYLPVGGICNRSIAQWSASGAGAQCASDERAGEATAFTYSTAPLAHSLHIAGPITVDLNAELDHADASFYAALTDVAPDGSSTEITAGALNASFEDLDRELTWRNSDGDVILPYHPFTVESQHDIKDYNPHTYAIEIYPTDWTLPQGHVLRVVISTADTPHYQVPQDRLAKMIGGTVRVLDGGSTPSRVLLPVID
ncbi:MAG: CocE/NonD family hydrolase [Actinomycetota bacterium]